MIHLLKELKLGEYAEPDFLTVVEQRFNSGERVGRDVLERGSCSSKEEKALFCLQMARNSVSRADWKSTNASCYRKAYDLFGKKFIDFCCKHMPNNGFCLKPTPTPEILKKHRAFPRHEIMAFCKEDASKYKTRKDWRALGRQSYEYARTNFGEDFMNECCKHMQDVKREVRWTLEACISDASNYKTVNEWRRGNVVSYNTAIRNGWRSECVSAMVDEGC